VAGKPDPKPLPRLLDPLAGKHKLLADPICRGCERPASEAHHILHRSLGGDDRQENLMPLCHACHRLYHGEGMVAATLENDELVYLERKLGEGAGLAYAARRYGFSWRTSGSG
jgi:hypothetical protein